MAAAEVVRARVETDLKKEATAVLSSMGLSVSDAIRLMLRPLSKMIGRHRPTTLHAFEDDLAPR
ncbi:MAG: hypothetical protein EOO77_04865 [Oxalobacteraceae bacterium]|nr:MAG: hypothetical protein EOO77_04865 [Oxalobacteraceae bacterium]